MNRFDKKAIITKTMQLIRRFLFKSGNFSRFTDKVEIEYTRISLKQLDKDNLYGSFKFLGDALVRTGIIKDDSPKFLNLVAKQEKGAIPKTIIIIKSHGKTGKKSESSRRRN